MLRPCGVNPKVTDKIEKTIKSPLMMRSDLGVHIHLGLTHRQTQWHVIRMNTNGTTRESTNNSNQKEPYLSTVHCTLSFGKIGPTQNPVRMRILRKPSVIIGVRLAPFSQCEKSDALNKTFRDSTPRTSTYRGFNFLSAHSLAFDFTVLPVY